VKQNLIDRNARMITLSVELIILQVLDYWGCPLVWPFRHIPPGVKHIVDTGLDSLYIVYTQPKENDVWYLNEEAKNNAIAYRLVEVVNGVSHKRPWQFFVDVSQDESVSLREHYDGLSKRMGESYWELIDLTLPE